MDYISYIYFVEDTSINLKIIFINMSEASPAPVPPSTDPYRVVDNFIQLANENSADVLDIGLSGKFVLSGTKYAVLYREAASSRLKFGTTSTKPTTTVAGLSSSDFECANAYCTNLTVSGISPSVGLSCDSSKNLATVSTLQLVQSYANLYVSLGATAASTANTWYTPGGRGLTLLMSNNTSDFTLSTATANTGVKYTGANALISISFGLFGSAGSMNAAVSVGAGTPAAPTFGTRAQNISVCRNDFNEGSAAVVSYYTTINTNQEIALYIGTTTTTFGIYSVFCNINVIRYI
jgi:hypothetical protein